MNQGPYPLSLKPGEKQTFPDKNQPTSVSLQLKSTFNILKDNKFFFSKFGLLQQTTKVPGSRREHHVSVLPIKHLTMTGNVQNHNYKAYPWGRNNISMIFDFISQRAPIDTRFLRFELLAPSNEVYSQLSWHGTGKQIYGYSSFAFKLEIYVKSCFDMEN